MSSSSETQYDPNWDDPLPHSLSPTKLYLSPLTKSKTKAVAIFVHGRGDNIDDMVGVFLPHLVKRYGGVESVIIDATEDEQEEKESSVGIVSVLGIEARDNVWYPASHNAIQSHEVLQNELYQYSAMQKIRETILYACESTLLPTDRIVLIGFSQGANLANAYLKAGLRDIKENQEKSSIPLPGHILALAGSLFKTTPKFPLRRYASMEHEEQCAEPNRQLIERLATLSQPKTIVDRLLCGTSDQFFPQDEIRDAASDLVKERDAVKDHISVQISVGFEPNAPHMITNRMVAATIEAIDAIVGAG